MTKTKVVTLAEVAKRFGVNKATARRWAKSGSLKGAFQFGPRGHWRISEDDLDKAMAARHSGQESGQGAAAGQ